MSSLRSSARFLVDVRKLPPRAELDVEGLRHKTIKPTAGVWAHLTEDRFAVNAVQIYPDEIEWAANLACDCKHPFEIYWRRLHRREWISS
jgi:hypothetical protein